MFHYSSGNKCQIFADKPHLPCKLQLASNHNLTSKCRNGLFWIFDYTDRILHLISFCIWLERNVHLNHIHIVLHFNSTENFVPFVTLSFRSSYLLVLLQLYKDARPQRFCIVWFHPRQPASKRSFGETDCWEHGLLVNYSKSKKHIQAKFRSAALA